MHTTSSADDRIRVALIGYGLAGRLFHGRLLSAAPVWDVVAIVTSDDQRQQQARGDFPAARVYARADDLWISSGGFDVVVVATGTASHAALALAAVAAGKHVVVEKPLAPTATQARELVDAGRARGVTVTPFLNRRWDSDHLTVQRLLREGALGSVLRYESRFDRWRPEPGPGAWREQLPASDGGGVLLDLGVHLVDQALSLHGPADLVHAEVFARRGRADDDVFMAVQHQSGVISHLWANGLAAAPGPRLRVLGSRAAYVVNDLDGQEDALHAGHSPGEASFGLEARQRWGRLVTGEEFAEVEPERGNWLQFYASLERCLRGDGPPPVPAEDGVSVLEVLDAARESARTGTVVHLTPANPPTGHD